MKWHVRKQFWNDAEEIERANEVVIGRKAVSSSSTFRLFSMSGL